jgi:hypothetical protein
MCRLDLQELLPAMGLPRGPMGAKWRQVEALLLLAAGPAPSVVSPLAVLPHPQVR